MISYHKGVTKEFLCAAAVVVVDVVVAVQTFTRIQIGLFFYRTRATNKFYTKKKQQQLINNNKKNNSITAYCEYDN